MREEPIRRIVGLLYDGVLSPQDWYDGLDTLREALGAGLFDYFTLDNVSSQVSNGVDNQGKVGLHAEKLREYQNHYISQDLRMAALAQMPVGRLMLDHEHISMREMSRNIVYTDFLRPHGFQHMRWERWCATKADRAISLDLSARRTMRLMARTKRRWFTN